MISEKVIDLLQFKNVLFFFQANVSKEITITKVGTAPIGNHRSLGNRSVAAAAGTAIKAGSSVEVISLDESPVKRGSSSNSAGVKRPNIEALVNAAKKTKTS